MCFEGNRKWICYPLYDALNKTDQHCIIQPETKMDEEECLAAYVIFYLHEKFDA